MKSIIVNRKIQPDSNVRGYLFLHIMKGKPCLQDSTVTVDTDKNKLVGILKQLYH